MPGRRSVPIIRVISPLLNLVSPKSPPPMDEHHAVTCIAPRCQPCLLEVNPNPAWGWDGKMCMMTEFAGHDDPGFLRMIVEAAHRRITDTL